MGARPDGGRHRRLAVEDEPCERAWLLQLRGLAGAALAEAERRLGDRGASRRAFREAKKLWGADDQEAGDALGLAAEMSKLAALQRR